MKLISLIDSDKKRLKGLKSLEKDLEVTFTAHKNILLETGSLSCELTHYNGFSVCKARIAIPSAGLSPSKGCRLWFLINKEKKLYIQCLLYLAKEKKNYKTSNNYNTVYARLKEWQDTLVSEQP